MKEENIKKMFGSIIAFVGIIMVCSVSLKIGFGLFLILWSRNLGIK